MEANYKLLGRKYSPDERDRGFLMKSLIPKKVDKIRTWKYWYPGFWWGDQKNTPHCVGYSWVHWLAEGPVTQIRSRAKNNGQPFDPVYLYNEAQKIDEWPGECVDTVTECLTQDGWKKYDQLVIGESILTFNIETQKNEWKSLEKVHVYDDVDYKIWGHKSIKVACTDNHKWPVRSRIYKDKFELVETKNWKSQHEFMRSANCSDVREVSLWDDEFIELMAWVVTEGSYRPEHRRGNGVIISQKTYKDEVEKVIRKYSAVKGYDKPDGSRAWELSGKLAKQIREIAPNRAPKTEWFLNISKKQLLLFIETCIKGDGSYIEEKENRQSRKIISQKTGPILDSILTACVLAGIPVSRSVNNVGTNSNVEVWTLRRSNYVETRKLKPLEIKHGKVWCPQTENRTFIARREGSIFITGNSYDGTSVRAGVKVLKNNGFVSEYRWAWSIEDIINTLLYVSPVVVGTVWTYDMFFPNESNMIKPTGISVGGHAYLIDGINTERGIIRIKNSWGREWGNKGFVYISIDDMATLISLNGEACVAVEVDK